MGKERIENEVLPRRTLLGLTQEELATAVGVSRQTIIAIEKGSYAPSVGLALKLARVCKQPVEKLFRIIHEK